MDTGTLLALAEQLSGTTLALFSFGMGCGAGYGFSARTVVKLHEARIAGLEGELQEEKRNCVESLRRLNTRVQEVENIMVGRHALPPMGLPGDMMGLLAKLDRQERDDHA